MKLSDIGEQPLTCPIARRRQRLRMWTKRVAHWPVKDRKLFWKKLRRYGDEQLEEWCRKREEFMGL